MDVLHLDGVFVVGGEKLGWRREGCSAGQTSVVSMAMRNYLLCAVEKLPRFFRARSNCPSTSRHVDSPWAFCLSVQGALDNESTGRAKVGPRRPTLSSNLWLVSFPNDDSLLPSPDSAVVIGNGTCSRVSVRCRIGIRLLNSDAVFSLSNTLSWNFIDRRMSRAVCSLWGL